MKLKEIVRKNRKLMLTITLIFTVSFIYGCQCEGGIGTSSEKIDTTEIISNDLVNN